jgi:hypothetical protein
MGITGPLGLPKPKLTVALEEVSAEQGKFTPSHIGHRGVGNVEIEIDGKASY